MLEPVTSYSSCFTGSPSVWLTFKEIPNNIMLMACTHWTTPIQWRIQDFPDGGASISKVGLQPIIWPKFPRKLHENKRIWTQGRRGTSLVPPPQIRQSDNETYEMAKPMASVIMSRCSVNTFIQFYVSHFNRSHYLTQPRSQSRSVWTHHNTPHTVTWGVLRQSQTLYVNERLCCIHIQYVSSDEQFVCTPRNVTLHWVPLGMSKYTGSRSERANTLGPA